MSHDHGADTTYINTTLQQARTFQQAGNITAAASLCHAVLKKHPAQFEALYLLGILEFQSGRAKDSAALIEEALKIRPLFAPGLICLGNILQALSRHEEAISRYDQALALQPASPEIMYNRGVALYALKRYPAALASYDRALAVKADYPEALVNRGMTLQRLQRPQEALTSYDRALAHKPDFVEANYNRGNVLRELNRLEPALASYDRVVALKPDHAGAFNNRGNLLRELQRYEEAHASYLRALAIRPDYPEALNNLGNLQRYFRNYSQALTCYEEAITLRPTYLEAINNRAIVLQDLRRYEEALAGFAQALSIRPDFADAHLSEGLCRLQLGDFENGWEKYEWRWQASTAPEVRAFTQPLWRGRENPAGKTILLYAEQGFGDTIQFCRYARYIAEQGAKVLLEVQAPLAPLLSRLEGPAQVLAQGAPLPDFDLQCPLLSLPRACHTTLATIPHDIPYLTADRTKVAAWRSRLGDGPSPRVGLAWSGRPTHSNDHNRSISLIDLEPLYASGIGFVSLQKEVRDDDRQQLAIHPEINHFGAALADFDDTAALIECLDLVITVDTAMAHLAGALGRPVWILLPYTSEWRWLTDREDSPWYPSARLFRQVDTRSWKQVIQKVAAELRRFA